MVLMDIQMPEMNGVEATRVIRKMVNPLKAGVPIIAITANTSRQAHKQFIAEGMNDWVIKPFKDETLYKKIALHIKDKDRLGSNISKRKFPQRKRPVVMSEALYDLSSLKRDQPENKAFIRRMLTIFVESIPPIVDRMQLHFEKGEMEAVSTLAHKIKPTLDGVAIHSLKDVIRNIEGYRDKKRTSEQLREDLDILQRVITEVVKMFEVAIDSLDS
jgi:CheY-like chemotaxis protein